MSRQIRTTEMIGDSFGVKIDHERLVKNGSIDVYRVTLGNGSRSSAYIDATTTVDDLIKMKQDIDEIIELCENIKKQEEVIENLPTEEVQQ